MKIDPKMAERTNAQRPGPSPTLRPNMPENFMVCYVYIPWCLCAAVWNVRFWRLGSCGDSEDNLEFYKSGEIPLRDNK